MSVAISEIRLQEVNEAAEFALKSGCKIKPTHIRHAMSLIARKDNMIVGVAICVGIKKQPNTKMIICGNEDIDKNEAQSLTDKAMMKMRPTALGKFEIRLYGSIADQDFWPRNNWLFHLDDTKDIQDNQPDEYTKNIA